jgi:hypothetical protein
VVACACHPSEIRVQAGLRRKQEPIFKITREKKAGSVSQHMPHKCPRFKNQNHKKKKKKVFIYFRKISH